MPDPVPETTKKEYRVVGPRAVFGTAPGETVELELTAEQETYFTTETGHLKEVRRRTADNEHGKE